MEKVINYISTNTTQETNVADCKEDGKETNENLYSDSVAHQRQRKREVAPWQRKADERRKRKRQWRSRFLNVWSCLFAELRK